MTTKRMYLLWDNAERGAFWKPGQHGYTCDIREAGRYDEATARRIVANAGVAADGTPDTIMMLEPTGRIPLPPTPADGKDVAATTLRSAFRSAKSMPDNPIEGIINLADQLGIDL